MSGKITYLILFSFFCFTGCINRNEESSRNMPETLNRALTWQIDIPEERMDYHDAVNYCSNLKHDGHNDWRLPTISELRTLIKNCKETEPGGDCKVTDNCLKRDECHSEKCRACKGDGTGKFSAFEDTSWFWSASQRMDTVNIAWVVKFYHGSIGNRHVRLKGSVRCVR